MPECVGQDALCAPLGPAEAPILAERQKFKSCASSPKNSADNGSGNSAASGGGSSGSSGGEGSNLSTVMIVLVAIGAVALLVTMVALAIYFRRVHGGLQTPETEDDVSLSRNGSSAG